MDNPEEVLHCLDEFAKLKPKDIPRELEDYLMYVARTGDPVYQWPLVKCLFREKLLNVITEFYENTPLDLPPSPNVDPFHYENMKKGLLERLEAFPNAPFTVQRLCELLTTPRKEYNRPDKFMRAIEKNILVVSTREPGNACRPDSALSEPILNGVEVAEPGNSESFNEENIPQASHTLQSDTSLENHVTTKNEAETHEGNVDVQVTGPSSSGSGLETDPGQHNEKDKVTPDEGSNSKEMSSNHQEAAKSTGPIIQEPDSGTADESTAGEVTSSPEEAVTASVPSPTSAEVNSSSSEREVVQEAINTTESSPNVPTSSSYDAESSSISSNVLEATNVPQESEAIDSSQDKQVNSQLQKSSEKCKESQPSQSPVVVSEVRQELSSTQIEKLASAEISQSLTDQKEAETDHVEDKNIANVAESSSAVTEREDTVESTSDAQQETVSGAATTLISIAVESSTTVEAVSASLLDIPNLVTEGKLPEGLKIAEELIETSTTAIKSRETGNIENVCVNYQSFVENERKEDEAMEIDDAQNCGINEAMAVTEEEEPMDDSEQSTMD